MVVLMGTTDITKKPHWFEVKVWMTFWLGQNWKCWPSKTILWHFTAVGKLKCHHSPLNSKFDRTGVTWRRLSKLKSIWYINTELLCV